MNAAQRRESILKRLSGAEAPVSASALAALLGVSRQIVVGDVALLRAGGAQIDATPRGYQLHPAEKGYTAILACVHSTEDEMRTELYTVVDQGGIVVDVAVENSLYGELRGNLNLASRYDVDNFIQQAKDTPEALLSRMTGGVHLHTLHCPDAGSFERIKKELEEKGHLKKGSAQLEDAVLIQEVIDQYRDKDTLQYQKMKALETAAYYDEAGKMQRLKEQFSDENGVLNIRALPYGKYLLVETTVPEGKVAAAPKVLKVDSDERDGLVDGDGKGTLQMGSAIWDQPQTSYLKIVKKDKTTGETVAKPGAKYVIHDVEGAYFNWYMEDIPP